MAACISFYPAKTLGCLGDGGCVVTNDDRLARQLRLLRDHGRDEETGEVLLWGLNSRLDNVQAAILVHKLERYDQTIERRRELAKLYEKHLNTITELVLPPGPDTDPVHFDIFQNYEIEAQRRDALRAYLRQRGVDTLIQWGGKAVHQFQALGLKASLPFTERLFERMIMLPMNQFLSDDDVEYVSDVVRDFYA